MNDFSHAAVSPDDLAVARDAFGADVTAKVAKNAVTSAGLRRAARVPEAVAANTLGFDIEVSQGKRTNQKRSGRCWMFASLNTMRFRTIKTHNLKNFELSQAYPLFFRSRSTAALCPTCSQTPWATAASGTCSARS